jgi:poly(beta-D-mannuronate) lyase
MRAALIALPLLASLISPLSAQSPPPTKLHTAPDPTQRRDVAGRLIANQLSREVPCPAPPEPVAMLDLQSVYRPDDPSQSQIDPKRLEEYRVGGLRAFTEGTNGLADFYAGTKPRDGRIAQCLARWMERWATGGALLANPVTPQGNAERKWMLAALALDYALVADAAEIGPSERATIEGWLGRLARAWLATPDYGFDRPNNHLNWGALALMATGAAVQDRDLYERGVALARTALAQIAADGSAPLELGRGERGVAYLVFALEPLVVAAEIGLANGIDLYAERDDALRKLAAYTRDAMLDPEIVARRTGVRQAWTGQGRVQPDPPAWGWAQAYLSRFPDAKIEAVLKSLRGASFRQLWLGDMALRFGRPPNGR